LSVVQKTSLYSCLRYRKCQNKTKDIYETSRYLLIFLFLLIVDK